MIVSQKGRSFWRVASGVLDVLTKRRPQPVEEPINLDEHMIEIVDLVGREPEQEREDEGSSIGVERY